MAEVPRYTPDADRPKKPENEDDDEEGNGKDDDKALAARRARRGEQPPTDAEGLPVAKSTSFIEALRDRWRETNPPKADTEATETDEDAGDTPDQSLVSVDWVPAADSSQFPETAAATADTPVNAESTTNAESTEGDAAVPPDELPAVADYESIESEPPAPDTPHKLDTPDANAPENTNPEVALDPPEDEETPASPPRPSLTPPGGGRPPLPPQPPLGPPSPNGPLNPNGPNGPFNPNTAAAFNFAPNTAQQPPSAETAQVVERHTVEQRHDALPYVLIGAEWMGRHHADKKEAKARQAGDAKLAEQQRQTTERLQADLHTQSKTTEANATQLKELLRHNQVQAAELQAKRQGSEARPLIRTERFERPTTHYGPEATARTASRPETPEAPRTAAMTPEQASPPPSKSETEATTETDLTHEAQTFIATELAPKIEAQTPHELDYELRQEIKDASADDIAAARAAEAANLEAMHRQKEAMLHTEALIHAQTAAVASTASSDAPTKSKPAMYRKAILSGLTAAGTILALILLAYLYALR